MMLFMLCVTVGAPAVGLRQLLLAAEKLVDKATGQPWISALSQRIFPHLRLQPSAIPICNQHVQSSV